MCRSGADQLDDSDLAICGSRAWTSAIASVLGWFIGTAHLTDTNTVRCDFEDRCEADGDESRDTLHRLLTRR